MSVISLAEALKLLSERKRLTAEDAIKRDPADEAEWLFSALGEYTGAELRELLSLAQEPGFFELMRAVFSSDEIRRQEGPSKGVIRLIKPAADVYESLKDLRRQGALSQLDEKLRNLTRFLEIQTLANRVFGDDKAAAWLNRTNSSFSGQKPIDLLKDELGAAVVREALEQIDHGIFA